MRVRLLLVSALVGALASCSLLVDTSKLAGGSSTDADSGLQADGGEGGGGEGGGGGACSGGCDDHDPCTDDVCTDAGACEHTANTAACDDGDPCTVTDTCKRGTCFSGAVTPACSANTTAIYRSVGPGAVEPLTTGASSSATMTLAGTTVLFDKAQPDRVGVGDAMQYDSNGDGSIDALAFIHQRLSSSAFRVRTADGKTPVPATDQKTWAIYRAYTSLADAARSGDENTGIDASLRNFDTWAGGSQVGGRQWNIACYADGVDAAPITICNAAYPTSDYCPMGSGGWTTSPTGYLRIFTPTLPADVGVSQRHKGRWGEGYRRTASLIVQPGAYVRIDGMSIRQANNDRTYFVLTPGIGGEVHISNSFGWSLQRTFDMYDGGYTHGTRTDVVKLWNDIGITDSTTDSAGAFYVNAAISAHIYNSTGVARAPSSGAFNDVFGTGTCKSCLAVQLGSAAGFVGTWVAVNTSASSDGSVGTLGPGNLANQTFSFVNDTGNDYHLVSDPSKNTGVRAKAENLSSSFTTDIDGDARPAMGNWDIGADQVP
jgi:hypothetical protein